MALGELVREWGEGQNYISFPKCESRVDRKFLSWMPQKKLSPNAIGVNNVVFVGETDTEVSGHFERHGSPAVCPTNIMFKPFQARRPSYSTNPFIVIDDEAGTQVANPYPFDVSQSWLQLGASLVKRTFSSSSLPLASEFNPSDALAQFLVDDGVENHLTPAEAKNRLKRFVRSFVGTIADSLEDRQIPRAQLTENGEFRENVARALLHRFPVRVYRQGDFLTALLKEITPVAMSGQFRTVSGVLTRANGELVVELTGHKAPPLLPDAPWVKATTPGN